MLKTKIILQPKAVGKGEDETDSNQKKISKMMWIHVGRLLKKAVGGVKMVDNCIIINVVLNFIMTVYTVLIYYKRQNSGVK